MNTRESLWITAVAAFAGGFVAGMLFAPHSGREARRRIATGARQSTRWFEEQLQQVEGHLNRLEGQLGEAGAHLVGRVRTATQSAVDQYVPSVPEEEEPWGVEKDDLAQDLRRLPRQ